MGSYPKIKTPPMIGEYPLFEKFGEGRLGPVYQSFDHELGRAAVVRILCDGIKWDAQLEETFHHECRAAAALQHPNIAAIYEIGKEEQIHYIVMESLAGKNLKGLFAQKPAMPIEAKLAIMIQMAEGLCHAHNNGILHRSLEPGKIHLTSDGVKIRDFAVSGILMKYLPHPGVRWGAPIYLSPEQIQQQSGNAQSDIFSLGVIFYELITYCHPFYDPDGNKALDKILMDSPISTFDLFPDVPPGLWPILKNCLAKDPQYRYASMNELLCACRDLMKDLAEDIQLMLAELHSSLGSLKKAAVSPDASEEIKTLLRETESLLYGQTEADYVSLDRLVNDLIEQHSVIQNAAEALQPWESLICKLPAFVTDADSSPAGLPVMTADPTIEPTAPPIPIAIALAKKPEEMIERPPAEPVEKIIADKPSIKKKAAPMKTAAINRIPEQAASPWSHDSLARPLKKRRYSRNFIPWRCCIIPTPSYRTIVILMSLLVIMTAAYIVFESRSVNGYGSTQSVQKPGCDGNAPNTKNSVFKDEKKKDRPGPPIIAPEPQLLAHISNLIDTGNLTAAKSELEAFQKAHPKSIGVHPLWGRWNCKFQEQKASNKQKESSWVYKVSALFGDGKYNEASNVLSLWISECPGSIRAQEFAAKNEGIQRALRTYSSAITENRYQDALIALGRAETINPKDSTFSELRQEIEAIKASASNY
jgi:serine/threonine protein kinase